MEENYWYRRHLAVYEWIAERVAGLRVADLACGEGYGADVLARTASDVVGVGRGNPGGLGARAPALPADRPALRAGTRGAVRGRSATRSHSCRRIEHVEEPRRLLERRSAPVAYLSTPNRLTLAPPGAEKSSNPWHLREYTPAEYRSSFSLFRVDVLCVFHARKLRFHEVALRLGWDRVHPALRLTKPFYHGPMPGGSRPPTSSFGTIATSTVAWRVPPLMSSSATAEQRPSGELGDLAIVLLDMPHGGGVRPGAEPLHIRHVRVQDDRKVAQLAGGALLSGGARRHQRRHTATRSSDASRSRSSRSSKSEAEIAGTNRS